MGLARINLHLNPNGAMNYTDPTAANFRTNAYWQLWNYAGENDGLWQCPSAVEDKAVSVKRRVICDH